MTILIVDDNTVSARIIEFNLKKHGYKTIYVKSGKDAIESLQSNLSITLVITDILMPEMTGLELLYEIKRHPEWKDIPVVMCTSLSDSDTVKKAAKAGCRHYILKPINKTHLLEKVREALADKKPILRDKFQVMSELGLDSDAYKEALDDFTLQVNKAIEVLEKITGEGSAPDISKTLAHIFEGSSLVGAERIKDVLQRLKDQFEVSGESISHSEYPLILRELKVFSSASSSPHVSDNTPKNQEEEIASTKNSLAREKSPNIDDAESE